MTACTAVAKLSSDPNREPRYCRDSQRPNGRGGKGVGKKTQHKGTTRDQPGQECRSPSPVRPEQLSDHAADPGYSPV